MAEFPDILAHCTGFQWDSGNADKNWKRHQVSQAECEQPFFNRPVLVTAAATHSGKEARLALFGVTNARRHLFIVLTVRQELVRVISARDMSKRERGVYERTEDED